MAKREPTYYSISQISCFRGCKQEWNYKYKDRLQLRAPQRPLYMGSTIHKLLEIRANGGDWKKHLLEEVQPEFERMPETYQANLGEDFIECLDKIMRQYEWAYQNEELKYLATEIKIDCKIKGNKRFIGVGDAIVEYRGEQYIMEHKTFKTTKMALEQTWLNQQTCLYIRVLNQQGWNIKGVIWDMIKTSCYKPPRVLKNGQFGKQYGEQTILSFLDAGITEIPENVLEEVQNNHLNFLDRYITPIQQSVIESVWEDFVETVNDISRNKSKAKNLGRDCEWCAFKDLCQTELTGGDVEYIKQLYYTDPVQRDMKILGELEKTPGCIACHKLADSYGAEIDSKQCIEYCEEFRKYKEAKKQSE